MRKINLRPLRLIRVGTGNLGHHTTQKLTNNVQKQELHQELNQELKEEMNTEPDTTEQVLSPIASVTPASATNEDVEDGAHTLLKRTPHSYLFNQIYGLWFYISWFVLTVIITHKVSAEQYGVFAVALTAYNTILYIVAFGLEDATTTYVPRLFSEHGQGSTASLLRRLLALRMLVLVISVTIILFGMSTIASLFALLPFKETAGIASSLRNTELLSDLTPIGIYVFGSSVGSLLTAVCAALARMRLVLIISGLTQLVVLCAGFVVLTLDWGTNGMLWLFALSSLGNALAFVICLSPLLLTRNTGFIQPLAPLLKLGFSAWLTNLVTGALLKQVSIILLGVFAVSIIDIGYFNLSFQLADSANLLLVAGFGGVAGSALAAAFVGNNHERFARSWQALIKVETLLAAPGLVFCLFNAQNIAHALYGTHFDPVGPLFAIFLFFNILVRIVGTTIHQSALYVVGKARMVVISQWIGLLLLIIFGVILIPRFGPAGALMADGISKACTGFLLLVFLLGDLPRRYPLELLHFTLRFMLALVLAALPSILWHPSDRSLLVFSGLLFIVLCALLLFLLKPLSQGDFEMLSSTNPTVARYFRWFVRNRDKGGYNFLKSTR